MDSIIEASLEALRLLLSGDAALWKIIATSFSVSTRALLLSIPIALIIASTCAFYYFPGRRLLLGFFNVLLVIPAVVIGLIVFLLLSRQGPLGDWQLLFTQKAMVIAQCLMCMPILVTQFHASFQTADPRAYETARTFGLPLWRSWWLILFELRFGLLAAVINGYSRILAEIGAALMVGGNILNYTRNITTAIGLETSKGQIAEGIALGIILVLFALILNIGLSRLQGSGKARP